MLQELISEGIQISPIIVDGLWCEIDTTQDLQRVKTLFK